MANVIGGVIVWNLDVDSEKYTKGIDAAKAKLAELNNSFDQSGIKALSLADVIKSAAEKINTGFQEIGLVSLGVAAGFVAIGTKAAFSASRIDELTLALHAIGKANNVTAAETDKAVAALRNNNIAYADALQVTSRFIQNELKVSDAIKLSNAAKDLAIIAGVGSSEATNMLTEAISSQSVMALRQFGIVKNLDDIYADYAKKMNGGSDAVVVNTKKTAANVQKLSDLQGNLQIATMRMGEFTDKTKGSTKAAAQMRVDKLNSEIAALTGNTTAYGKAAGSLGKDLTEAQKKQAFLNAVLEAGTKVTGTYAAAQLSSGKQFRSFTTRILPDFIAQLGRAFEPSLVVVVQSLTQAVEQLGKWFDANKSTVKAWGDQLAAAVKIGVDFIGQLFAFLIANGPVVQGILTAMVIGVGFLAAAFLVAHAPAILLFGAITGLIVAFGGWQNIINTIMPALNFLGAIFHDLILPQLQALWAQITTQLVPAFMELWQLIAPVVIPTLQVLGAIIGITLLGAITLLITGIRLVVLAFTAFVIAIKFAINEVITTVKGLWDLIVGELTNWKGMLFDWGVRLIDSFAGGIISNGMAVVNAITNVLNKAKKLLEGHSPPIMGPFKEIDKWGMNVGRAWAEGVANGVKDLSLPTVQGAVAMSNSMMSQYSPSLSQGGRGGKGVEIHIAQMNVRDQSDIASIGMELGFRVQTSPEYTENG